MTTPLFERVLVPIAEPEDAKATCEAVVPYLESSGEVVVVHVIEKTEGGPDKAPREARQAQATEIFALAREQFGDAGYDVETELRYGPDVVDEILATAAAFDVTAIAFTPRPGGRWIKLLTGNRANRLTRESTYPILIVPHSEKETPEITEATAATTGDTDGTGYRVLVPIDGTEEALSAVSHACRAYPTADVTCLYVHESASTDVYASMTGGDSSGVDDEDREWQQEVTQRFEEAQAVANDHGVELETVTFPGAVPDAIVTCADELGVDLIVMATRGREGLKQKLLGSTTETVVRRSPVPVTVVR
ncbi:Nucleotide-binding universal stress protein, UspA family [Natronorubrum sediminis]|uniref:Nucleotide-binding universal stress protein, UspA family n=1 Tax=Natronorubrum sediminis TaxID=640943 RepID=A0A1H6G513_9EURY|nr:universal stress protein [Natronorubrum sediminis]SEH17538.1 Nucleotide-binding universal stress protein, UspA family [Natronorubrum sediminis]